ncbi:hypothetical protein HGH92_29775 [Chitinophaga varians]|uniref:Uncharacterized protein n=1 Tax=Chitinophaga varians TaxID=2202339 RepID=A0A847S9Z1_9BACT|nr:hypothetical protein [Chitinophaga varians]NLR68531.1 hypothetical protein [Chitinophaga varians]
MGEYVRYNRTEVKIGTVENMYYTSFQKFLQAYKSGHLKRCEGNDYPINYLLPENGNRFRFPFPDEDGLPFGEINGDYMRGLPVRYDPSKAHLIFGPDDTIQANCNEISIVQQRLVHRQSDGKLCLAVVYQGAERLARLEDDDSVKNLLAQIVKHHIASEPDADKKHFYRQVCLRILKGYHLHRNLKEDIRIIADTGKLKALPPKGQSKRKL